MKDNIPYKIYLSEAELPKQWYNVRADMKNKPAPLLNPGTLQPMTAEELGHVFCDEPVSYTHLAQRLAYGRRFEQIRARNFAKEQHARRKFGRPAGKAEFRMRGKCCGIERHADGTTVKALGQKCIRVRKEAHRLRKGRKERQKSARVVVMPMGEHDIRHAGKVNPHAPCVFKRAGGIARVKQNGALPCFQQVASSGFPQIITVDIGAVSYTHLVRLPFAATLTRVMSSLEQPSPGVLSTVPEESGEYRAEIPLGPYEAVYYRLTRRDAAE